MNFFKLILVYFIVFSIYLVVLKKQHFQEKYLQKRNYLNVKIQNKNDLISKFGHPSYIDNILK